MIELISADIVTVYAAMGSNEMSHSNFRCGVFSDHYNASQAAKGKGEWGSDGHVTESKAMKLSYDDGTSEYYLLDSDKPLDLDGEKAKADAKLKEETLANMTSEQKRVLGL